MRKLNLLDIDLRLFDGAAGAAGEGAGEGAAQDNNSALPKADTKAKSGSSRRSRSGDLSNVVYGKQDEATSAAEADVTTPAAGENKGEGNANTSGVSTTSDSLEAKRQAYRELMEGEYKDIYTEDTQRIINKRFRETKELEASINDQKPIIDLLMQRYKIADGDVKKLQTAIEQDDVYWEAAAEEAGLTVEQFKAMQKLERDSEELTRLRQRQQNEQRAQQQLATWYQEAEQVKQLYPAFNFEAETKNRDFIGLLRSGLKVQQAYELIHMDEIKTAAAKTAAETAGQQMVAKMKSNAARPLENGTSTQSAALVKNDVHSLTRADRAEVARRAARGEKIQF